MAVSPAANISFDPSKQYGLISRSSDRFLDSTMTTDEETITFDESSLHPIQHPKKSPSLSTSKDKDSVKWCILRTNDNHWCIKALAQNETGKCLDGRNHERNPCLTARNPTDDKVLQWDFIAVNGHAALRCVSNGKFLDGRSHESHPVMTDRTPVDDHFLQWTIWDFTTNSKVDLGDGLVHVVFCGAKWQNARTIPPKYSEKITYEIGWSSESSRIDTKSETKTQTWSVDASQDWNIYGQGGNIKAHYENKLSAFQEVINKQTRSEYGHSTIEKTFGPYDENMTMWQLMFWGRIEGTKDPEDSVRYFCQGNHIAILPFGKPHPALDLSFFEDL